MKFIFPCTALHNTRLAAGCWPAPRRAAAGISLSWHLLQLNSAKFYVLGHLPKAPWPRILGKTRKNFFAEMQLISSRQQWAVTNHVVLWFLLEVEYLFSPQWYSQNNLKYVFWSISYSQGTMSGLKLLWPPSKPSLPTSIHDDTFSIHYKTP